VFAYHQKHGLYFLTLQGVTAVQPAMTSTRSDAIIFKTKSHASHVAHLTGKQWDNLQVGIANEATTGAEIKKKITGK
jgi:hypothetical protein